MTTKNTHSFDACSLRSSSLLIVHHEQQIIVTASDELFNILGYQSGQLIDQPLSLLSLSTKNRKQFQRVKIQHAKTKQWIKLKICIHHDPFSTSSGLDYCLVALSNEMIDNTYDQTTTTTVNLIGLNAYGTIVHAYPTIQFPQKRSRQLLGKPIMSFVHNDDIVPLFRLLRKCTNGELFNHHHHHQSSNEASISIRWLYSCLDTNRYEWMQLTVVNPIIYNQVPSLSGHPICLLQPIPMESSAHPLISFVWDSIEDGKSYCHEFLNHVIVSLTQLIYDLTPTRLTFDLPLLPMIIPSSFQKKKVKDNLFYFMDSYSNLTTTIFDFISTIIHFHIPNAWLPDTNSFGFLKPILPQTKTPSSNL